MRWYERIIQAHTSVTSSVSHARRLKSDRYFVWLENGSNDFMSGNRHTEKIVTGTTDLFTKKEFDPWVDEFEKALNKTDGIAWSLDSIQYEDETSFFHYQWVWDVKDG